MCKSQLMQAAGRLRQLGRGQTLQVVGLPDVTEKILAANAVQHKRSSSSKRSSSVSMQQVLQWVMSNTVQATLHGVTPWASQGLYFISCKASADLALQEDDLLPVALYGSSKAPQPVPDVVAGLVKQHLKAPALQGLQERSSAAAAATAAPAAVAVDSHQLQLAVVKSPAASPRAFAAPAAPEVAGMAAAATQQLRQLVQQIQANASKCGEGHWVVAGAGVNEECERELEQEEEEEEVQEVQVPRVDPAAEQDWPYAAVMAACTASYLSAVTRVHSLPAAMPLLQASAVCSIPWSSKVFVTANFIATTAAATAARSGQCLSQYLRPVDSLLLFADGSVLLLSERENEGILEQLWKGSTSSSTSSSSSRPVLLSLSYARLARSAAAAAAAPTTAAAAPASLSFLARPLQPISSSAASASRTEIASIASRLPAVAELVSVHLFNGASMFDGQNDPQQLQVLHGMVKGRREAAEMLLDSRGRQAQLSRSELELACDEHAAVAKRSCSAVLVSAPKRSKG
jgi:hypothetical protein